jgi:endonuclease III
LFIRAAHGRSIRTSGFGKQHAKAVIGIAGVQIEREAIEALHLADIDALGKVSGVGVKLEIIELQNGSRAIATADGART